MYLEKSPEKLSGFLGRGRCYFGKKYMQGAEIDFTNALREDKGNFEAHYLRGMTRVKRRNFVHGLSDLNKALAIDSTHVRSHYYRGIARAASGMIYTAIRDFDFVIANEPEIIEAFYNRAFCYERRFDFYRAIQDYTSAIDRRPGYANALMRRGVIYLFTGQEEAACRDFMLLNKLKDERGPILMKKYCPNILA